MKRKLLITLLEKHGCILAREGSKHGVFVNPALHKISTVPRHNEINEILAKRYAKI